MSFICYNGSFYSIDQPVLLPSNRSYKWGDGIFETIKVCKGQISLKQFHFDRLLISLQLLQISIGFTIQELEKNILELCLKNDCSDLGRVRLAVFRLDNDQAGYTIEAIALDQQAVSWNEAGYKIDIYPYTRKGCDVWANLKTANYLPYIMADRYAKDRGFQEVLVLNSFNQICDASKANVFIIKDQELITPALDQGGINGVMRRNLISQLKKEGYIIKQESFSEDLLLQADECFLTNAVQGIRWVRQYRDKLFDSTLTKQIYKFLFEPAPDRIVHLKRF